MSERLKLAGPAGTLEAVLEGAAGAGDCYAVVCHPHPLYGGNMDNKVVTTVARALVGAGYPTLRFNFRGVEGSGGSFDDGIGETVDAETVAAWGEQRFPGKGLIVAGFSYGGSVAIRLASLMPTRLLISVAPAIELLAVYADKRPTCPWTVIQGDADDVVDPQVVQEWVESLDPAPHLVMLPGVGHFFHGRLQELGDAVTAALR
jgi:alpha/beta superfamily hydrolase